MIKTYDVIAKEKPKWYQLRWKLSNLFVKIAKWIYPENPAVKAFLLKKLTDFMIYGGKLDEDKTS